MGAMTDNYIHARGALPRFAAAIARGKITVGFVGGSITEPAGGRRWSDKLIDWLEFTWPGLDITVENAAKGATGSLSAVFRAEGDILPCGCDIVFVETAVNDGPGAWGDCREGLLRKLLKADSFDVALVYTYCQGFYEATLAGELPDSVKDWERLAEHYGVSSVLSGQYAFDLTAGGFMRWEEWLPDGLHPEFAGSRAYVEPIARLLEAELARRAPIESRLPLPAPLSATNWEGAYMLPFEAVTRRGPWRRARVRRLPTVDYELYTASMRAGLSFDFEGRGVVLRLLANGLAAGYRWRVDGGEWTPRNDRLPEWGVRATDWVREDLLTDALPEGAHRMEIETLFAPDAKGSNFELCTIGIVR